MNISKRKKENQADSRLDTLFRPWLLLDMGSVLWYCRQQLPLYGLPSKELEKQK